LAFTVLVILVATLRPTGWSPVARWQTCVICGEYGGTDLLRNVLLFLPLGFLLHRRTRFGVAGPLLVAAALSGAIESLQWLIPGRTTSLTDLAANTAGAAIGLALARTSGIWGHPGDRTAARLSLAWALFLLSGWGLSGWLLQPSLPSSTYYGQWTADLGHLEHYGGRVQAASVGNIPLPSRRLPDSRRVRGLLSRGVPLEITFTVGPPVDGLAPIFSIFDEREREIALVGADSDDLVLRIRTRAAAARLTRPDLRLRDALRGVMVGEMARVSVWRRNRIFCLSLAGQRKCGGFATPGRGWSFLWYPTRTLPRWLEHFLDGSLLLAFGIPLGMWWRRRPEAALGVAVILLAPVALGRAVGSPGEWGSALSLFSAGALAGVGVRRWMARGGAVLNPRR